MQKFVSLHHHDEYSIRDGLRKVDDLIKLLKATDQKFCSITNHGTIGGWIRQYNACKKEGIKAIFGMEAYQKFENNLEENDRKNSHLILIAKNLEGFKNIIKIHNDAHINGFHYRPRTNFRALKMWGKGVIGSSACMGGLIPHLLMEDKYEEAKKAYERYKSCLDEFYIELDMVELERQVEVNNRLVRFANDVGAKMIATCDSHYIYPEDGDSHEVLIAIQTNSTIHNPTWKYESQNLYYRSEEDMIRLWSEGFVDKKGKKSIFKSDLFNEKVYFDAIENTFKVASECEEIKLDSSYKLPKLYENASQILVQKAKDGFLKRKLRGKIYSDRLNYELKIINDLGFADYLLVVEKIIQEAVGKFGEFFVGPGRGSAAGSLVLYCLGVTNIDPVKYGLLFERFISYDRSDLPDVDMDFEPTCRDWIKKRIVELFGENNTCSIGTYQFMRTKNVLQNISRALGLGHEEIINVTRKIDGLMKTEVDMGEGETEDQKIDQMELEEIKKHFPEISGYLRRHPEVEKHFSVLRNQISSSGKHAAGMIISNLDLQDIIPVIRDTKTSDIVSSWVEGQGIGELSSVGLIKFDILGLNNLTIIYDCVKYIEKNKGIKLSINDIPIDDEESIRFCSKNDLVGIFQFENPATKPIADSIGMESLEDISAVTSLIRPGPKNMGMDEEFAKRKKGKTFEYFPGCEESLKPTKGVLIYQENVMEVAKRLGGFTPQESNQFRKILSKGKPLDKIAALRKKFIEGAKRFIDEGKLTEQKANEIFDLCESFSKYGFNKCLVEETVVETEKGFRLLGELKIGEKIKSPIFNEDKFIRVLDIIDSGEKEVYEITLENGYNIRCTLDHKFLCPNGKVKKLEDIILNSDEIMCED